MSKAKSTGWRDLIQVHPAAELFPLMPPEELQALGEDIKANGLTAAVTTWVDEDGTEWLLDGRNRLDAMAAAGYRFKYHGERISSGDYKGLTLPERFKVIPPPKGLQQPASTCVDRYLGHDPYAFVTSANIRRRHLTQDQKRELIGKLLKTNPERSDRATAKLAQASDKTVGAVREKLEATAEIPQLDKRTGADGKARSQPRSQPAGKKSAAKAESAPVASISSAEPTASSSSAVEETPSAGRLLNGLNFGAALAEVRAWYGSLQSVGQLAVADFLTAMPFEATSDGVSLWCDELTGAQQLELADGILSRLDAEQLDKLGRLQQWRRWEPTGVFDAPKVPHAPNRPMVEVKVLARNEWQTKALEDEPTTPEEATLRYNAISWESAAIYQRYNELITTQGKVLEGAKRFFPNLKEWKAWLKSHKTCYATSIETNHALNNVGYSPEGVKYKKHEPEPLDPDFVERIKERIASGATEPPTPEPAQAEEAEG